MKVCVYDITDINWDEVETLDFKDNWESSLGTSRPEDHDNGCSFHDDNKLCDCSWEEAWTPNEIWYTDGEWETNGQWKPSPLKRRGLKYHTVFVHNYEKHTVQVVHSPLSWKRGPCSPCYPNQCDAYEPGDIGCFRLPNWLVENEDLWVGDDPEYGALK
jgi:hypothetical protein